MPQTLTDYFNAMEASIILLDAKELTARERSIQTDFLALCTYGKLLEEKGVKFTLREGEDTLIKKTAELFDKIGDEPATIYYLDSSRLIELAKIYRDETEKLLRGEYQYFVRFLKIFRETPENKKQPLKENIQKIERSITHYTPTPLADDDNTLLLPTVTTEKEDAVALTSSDDADSVDTIPIYSTAQFFGPNEALALQNFMCLNHAYHARRAQALYLALVECLARQDRSTMLDLVQQQLDLQTLTKPRSGWTRWRHFRLWWSTDAAQRQLARDSAWHNHGPADTFHADLITLKHAISA